jgi:hypothetical protein
MQTKEFLQSIWSDQGYYCICGKDQKNIVTPKFVNSINDALKISKQLLDDKQDVYFTCQKEQVFRDICYHGNQIEKEYSLKLVALFKRLYNKYCVEVVAS